MQLEVQDVVKRFDRVLALDHCSLSLRRGEIVTLLGASGAGKTTLLWVIAGLLSPDQGQIRLCGRDITRLAPNRREVGLVFQSYALFPHLSVFDNIAFGLKVRHVRREDIRARVGQMMALMGIEGLERRLPAMLSGGQQQRAALARALVLRPELIVMDEPFNALDAGLRDMMQAELRRLMRELDMTALIVTHEQAEALAISDRIAIMHEGRILQADPPLMLYDRPSDRRVAAFIGSANLLRRTSRGGEVRLGAGMVLTSEHEGAVLVVVRPENLDVVPFDTVGALQGFVLIVRPLGPNVTYEVDVGWEAPLKVSQQRMPTTPLLVEGQLVGLDLRDPRACVILQDR